MAAVTQQPTPGGGTNNLLACDPAGYRDWTSGTFSCFSDCKSLIMTYCCLPFTLCTISSQLGDCALMPFCVPASVITMRTRTRAVGGIKGTMCRDCMATSLCYMCTVCQIARELDAMRL